MANLNLNQNKEIEEIIFPEETSSIIGEFVSKYGLEKTEKEMLKRMIEVKTFKEKEKIFESLPGRQIAKIIKEVAQDKISSKDLVLILEQRLNVSRGMAEKLAEDIEKRILVFIKKIPLKKEEVLRREKLTLSKKPIIEKTKIKPEISFEKPSKKDVYREPVE